MIAEGECPSEPTIIMCAAGFLLYLMHAGARRRAPRFFQALIWPPNQGSRFLGNQVLVLSDQRFQHDPCAHTGFEAFRHPHDQV